MIAATFWAFNTYIHYTVYEFGLETPLAAFFIVLLLNELSKLEGEWRVQPLTRKRIAALAIIGIWIEKGMGLVVPGFVPTPLGEHREPDNGYIHSTAREIAKRLRRGQLVVLESTTYPGTTDEEVHGILAKTGLQTPGDYFLAFSPEREDPGNKSFHTQNIPKVVGGMDPASLEVAAKLYGAVMARVVPVSSPEVAEAAKILERHGYRVRLVNLAWRMLRDGVGPIREQSEIDPVQTGWTRQIMNFQALDLLFNLRSRRQEGGHDNHRA